MGVDAIWSGRQAQENGLVDELGGLSLALAIAQEYAGLQEKVVEIIRFPKQTRVSQFLSNFRLVSAPLHQVVSAYIDGANKTTKLPLITRYGGFSDTVKLINTIRQHRLFLLMPYQITMGE